MKKKWYRGNVIKGALLILAAVSFTAAICCGAVLLKLMGRNFYVFRENGKNYVSSQSFANDVQNSLYSILEGIQAQEMLEETDAAGKKRVIDLQEVYDRTKLTYEETSGLAYAVEDLKKWAAAGWSMDPADDSSVIVCRQPDGRYGYYDYDEFARMFTDGELSFVIPGASDEDKTYAQSYTMETLAALRSGQFSTVYQTIVNEKGEIRYADFWNYGPLGIQERYSPVGAGGILDIVNRSDRWNGRLQEAVNALETLLTQTQYAQACAEKLDGMRAGNTNLTYLVADTKKWKIHTNRAQAVRYSQRAEAIRQLQQKNDAYIIIRPTLSECETNLNTYLQPWHQMVKEQLGEEDYEIALFVDTSFPIEDSYAMSAREYRTYTRWVRPLMAAGISCTILFMVCLVWLTVVAGRQSENEELHLCAFDKWFTELSALLVAGVWMLVTSGAYRLLEEWMYAGAAESDDGVALFCAAGFAAFTIVLFLIGFLSLVRRIKANSLWKDSLFRRIVQQVRGFFQLFAERTPGKIKVTAAVCAYLLLAIFGAACLNDIDAFLLLVLVMAVVVLVFALKNANAQASILKGLKKITGGDLQYKIPLDPLKGEQRMMAEYINHIGDGLDAAVENSLKNERMKTELITNVSHDIKTPLTSIVNYVDLLKRENLQDPKLQGYIEVLEKKTQRLKTLTEDVVEASKASTGNINLNMADLDFLEIIHQVCGEFDEKFKERKLEIVSNLPQTAVLIHADGQQTWRVLENVFNNIVKYAMERTRVYIDMDTGQGKAAFFIKNISAQPLNISADELTERFIRGDVARNTEGSGLGLSIAKSLTELQDGDFRVYVDGDLFKVMICFRQIENS